MRMTMSDYVESIKLQLFAGILEPELDDDTIERLVNTALVEMNRYYSVTNVITVPASNVIDLSQYPDVNIVVNVFRTQSVGTAATGTSMVDPMYMAQMAMYNIGSSYYNNQ